ncbi:hypothetical protein DFH09DRAFT_1150701 [Mycena vulgaris]|nr:hypothetical protein DFH09DRAFT_1150701 [Mycena vulgaris]
MGMEAEDPTSHCIRCVSGQMNIAIAPRIDLQELGKDVHISYGNERKNPRDPRVIILFGWMDAPSRILDKYAMNHRLRWPSSDIVVVQSHPAYIWMRDEKREDILRPLATYLISTIYHPRQITGGILLHVLSNGGAFQLVTLSNILHSIISSESSDIRNEKSIRLATIIDSAPGTGQYSSMLATLTTGLNSPAVKAVLAVPVFAFYVALRVRGIVIGQENLFTLLHLGLQTPELLPLTDSHAPRVYIYSAADSMVPATSVEEHISVLRKSTASFDIKVERFTDSEHVLHERQNSVRYWNAVRAVWDRSAPICAKL